MGKLAQGSSLIKLFPNENIIESLTITEKEIRDLILITNKATFVKYNTNKIRLSKKGELGTIGIKFKDKKNIKNRLINCFINNKHIYIKTNKDRYEKLETEEITSEKAQKEKKLGITLHENEFIESAFSMVLPENN